jgi:oligoendopeptidase F
MFERLPADARAAIGWGWDRFAPYVDELANRPLSAETIDAWMEDWSRLSSLLSEIGARVQLEHHRDTAEAAAEERYLTFLNEIAPAAEAAEQRLREKLLASGIEPRGMAVPLRGMRAEVSIYRDENLALFVEDQKLGARYDKLVGAQSVEWEGRQTTVAQLRSVFEDPDRGRRERAWRLARSRQLEDREQMNAIWSELLKLRHQIALNAGLPNYRSYVWQIYRRFDYTPEDCLQFHAAIEQVCTPAAARIYERHRRALGLERLRSWDLIDGTWDRPVDSPGAALSRPFRDGPDLIAKTQRVFDRLDPALAQQFSQLADERLLDLENRPGKAPGGYCTYFATARRPFILMNTVGVGDDVQTMLHEAGHAFHAIASAPLPYYHQLFSPMEFNEVAAMGMELLTGSLLNGTQGFYSSAEAASAQIAKFEQMICFWPYMAVIDAFQHWAYTVPEEAADPARCDETWRTLWARFMPALDWDGLEAERDTGWHRRLHLFRVPFYYVEYGLAALGAAQIWRNSLSDHAGALSRYRGALALGGTATVHELYTAAGASFAFDAGTLGEIVALIEQTIDRLEQVRDGV